MMNERAELTFATTALDGTHGTRVIRIPNPMATVTQNVLNLAENGFLMANPFDETIGSLEKLKSAERVIVERVVLI